MKWFTIKFLLFALVVAGGAVALQAVFKDAPILSPHFWLIFTVIFALTLVAYLLSDLGIRKGKELSVYALIGGLFIKLMASLVLILVLFVKFPENKLITAINFFSIYLLFTIFEVTYLLRNLRDQNGT